MEETFIKYAERIKTGKFSDNPELQQAYEQGRLDERCVAIYNQSMCACDEKKYTPEQLDNIFPQLVKAINTGNKEDWEAYINALEEQS